VTGRWATHRWTHTCGLPRQGRCAFFFYNKAAACIDPNYEPPVSILLESQVLQGYIHVEDSALVHKEYGKDDGLDYSGSSVRNNPMSPVLVHNL
jgi:hypothetical protein